jgi:hypothetical protein
MRRQSKKRRTCRQEESCLSSDNKRLTKTNGHSKCVRKKSVTDAVPVRKIVAARHPLKRHFIGKEALVFRLAGEQRPVTSEIPQKAFGRSVKGYTARRPSRAASGLLDGDRGESAVRIFVQSG